MGSVDLAAPRFEEGQLLQVAGLSNRYAFQNTTGIPAQWARFNEVVGRIPGAVGDAAYGVSFGLTGDGFDYLSGVEVADLEAVPGEFARLTIPAHLYAVFHYPGHISAIQQVMGAIWQEWLPVSGYRSTGAPAFERYGPSFDPSTGSGGFEVWVPVAAA